MIAGLDFKSLIFAATAGFLMTVPHQASACAVCTGGADSAVAPAMNAAILLMLGFIGSMLAGVGGFAFYLHRRSKMPAPPHEQLSEMIYKEGFNHHA